MGPWGAPRPPAPRDLVADRELARSPDETHATALEGPLGRVLLGCASHLGAMSKPPERTSVISSHTTPFILASEEIAFPGVAPGSAIKNSAKRFEAAWGLPADGAFALAAAMVDP